MSELRLGGLLVDTIGQLKVGSSNVTAAYVGSVKVFPASTTTTTSTTSTTTTTLIPTTTTTSTTSTTTTTLIPTTTTTSTTTSTTTATPTTTTSTTTSTTTAAPTTSTTTTTTTTTAPVGTWKIANSSDDLDISGISIGGSSGVVTIGSFPSTPSTNIEGTTQLISIPGTYTVTLVLVTSGTTGQTIKITDSNGTVQTQTIPNPNSGDITFTNVYFNASVQVLIECLSAPIPTTTTTTTSTTTTTTTEAPTTTTTSTTTTTTTSAPSSVTIFWNTSEVGSGGVRLVIYDSTSTPIVDEESSGAGPTNGSVTTSNTPFTVAVSRIAGTEVAQYRICNDSTSTEITHNYSVTSEVTYVVDPTPLTTTIFATYGDSNTPSNCSVE